MSPEEHRMAFSEEGLLGGNCPMAACVHQNRREEGGSPAYTPRQREPGAGGTPALRGPRGPTASCWDPLTRSCGRPVA